MWKLRPRAFALIISIFFCAGVLHAQNSEARLVDEFSRLSCCCDLSARLDMLFAELAANEGTTGYVVVAEPPVGTLHWRENYFDGYIGYRKFDENRVQIVRKPGVTDPFETQLWIVPSGTPFEQKVSGESSYVLDTKKRKSLFYDGDYSDSLCYNRPPFRLLAKYLSNDAGLTANISIGTTSHKAFNKEKEDISERFKTVYGIDPTRLRFFRTRGKFEGTFHEIWLVRKTANRNS